jgi:FkbH-like protein
LLYLKRRGILLAINSKNDRAKIEAVWDKIFHGFISLSDFASVKINWQPKEQNMEEILAEVNLLAKNAVFIDDNPREREAVKAAFPDIRVLGSHPYYLKRILLWSGETQVPYLTDEAGRRTEMIQTQIKRDETRKKLSREEFLASLNMTVRLFRIGGEKDGQFARMFELLNKTNQFNTTGERWTHADIVRLQGQGGTLYAFEVEDKYSKYGLVGLAIVEGNCIRQFAMSCRVIGLDAEVAVLSAIEADMARQGHHSATARFIETSSNSLCRELYKKLGYVLQDGLWVKNPLAVTPRPTHVRWQRK